VSMAGYCLTFGIPIFSSPKSPSYNMGSVPAFRLHMAATVYNQKLKTTATVPVSLASYFCASFFSNILSSIF
jgi:hypothetical protein